MKLLIVLLIPVYTFVLFTMLYKGFIWVFKIDEKGENAEITTITPTAMSMAFTVIWTIFTICMLFKYDYL